MIFQAICLISLTSLSVVNCEPPSPQYGAPISSYGTPNYNTNHNNHQDNSAPKSYEFGYQVKDDYSGNNYKRQEASDGNQVQGEYRVQLPDGRTQIVTYYADWQSGFHADVRYEGQAQYPENYGNGGGVNGFGGQHGFGGGAHGFGGGAQGLGGGAHGFGGGAQGFGGGAHGFGGGAHGFGGQGGFGSSQHGGSVSNQYGTPGYAGNFNGNAYNLNNNFNSPATSSVSIKDYSGPGTPYNVGGNNGGYANGHGSLNGGYNFGNQGGFDSYSHAGSFGNKVRPSTAYGAP